MFSFSTISIFATLAFGAISSALPTVPAVSNLNAVSPVVNSVANAAAVPSLARRATPGVAEILTGATAQIQVIALPLQHVNTHNATYDHVKGPIGEIVEVLTITIADLKLLVGLPLDIILASVGSTVRITVKELGVIVAGLLLVVFKALGAILAVVGVTVDKVLFDLLVSVGVLVGSLLTIVGSLVGVIAVELFVTVLGLVGVIVPIIIQLDITVLITLLKIRL